MSLAKPVTIKYDPEADAAYIRFTEQTVSQTQEESDVCILDLDAAGNLVGIELLSVFGFAGASLSGLVKRESSPASRQPRSA